MSFMKVFPEIPFTFLNKTPSVLTFFEAVLGPIDPLNPWARQEYAILTADSDDDGLISLQDTIKSPQLVLLNWKLRPHLDP